MKLSTFFNEKDNDPKLLEATWEGLIDSLKEVRKCACSINTCHRSDCAGKLGQAWSPAWWESGATRKAALTKEVCALVIDFDKLDDLALLGKLEAYKLIIHGSHSDSVEQRCLRVVVALSHPVEGRQWTAFWNAAMRYLEIPLGKGGADKACSDPSRIFFLPSRPYDACHAADDGSGFAFEAQDGKVLNVDAVMEMVEETTAPTGPTIVTRSGAFSQEAVDLLAGGWPDNGRHDAHRALCGALARMGWAVEEIADFVAAVCEQAHPGNGNYNKRLKSAVDAVSGLENGRTVWGWTTVMEHVDPDTVTEAMRLLGAVPKRDDKFTSAFANIKYEVTDANLDNLVVLSRDEVQSNLQAAKRRLARTTSAPKILEATILERVLKGKPQEDTPFEKVLQVVIKHAGKGAQDLTVAEYLASVRPDLTTDQLCEMIASARKSYREVEKASTPEGEFEMDFRTGKPSTTSQRNFALAFQKMGVTFLYDAFARRKIIEYDVDGQYIRETVTDDHILKLMFEIEQTFEFCPSKEKLFDYARYVAKRNTYHPVLDYLDGLEDWDEESRLETWLIDYAGAEDTPYVRAVSRLLLLAAVRRVRRPGAKFDEMMILESPQGTGKSTAIRTLCPNEDWFTDNFSLDGDSKKMIEQTAGKWIVEAGELRGLSVRDHNAMKQYLSSTHDEARMAYARESERVARQFVIVGTTNDQQYLRDHTGDRRYWPIRVTNINIAALEKIRDQLWAEASIEEAKGVSIRLDPSLYEAAGAEQAKRRVDNAVKVRLEEHLADKVGRIKVSDTWKLVCEDYVTPQPIINQVTNAMQELGWTRVRGGDGENRFYVYVKGTKAEQKRVLHVHGNPSFGFTIKYLDEVASN